MEPDEYGTVFSDYTTNIILNVFAAYIYPYIDKANSLLHFPYEFIISV